MENLIFTFINTFSRKVNRNFIKELRYEILFEDLMINDSIIIMIIKWTKKAYIIFVR